MRKADLRVVGASLFLYAQIKQFPPKYSGRARSLRRTGLKGWSRATRNGHAIVHLRRHEARHLGYVLAHHGAKVRELLQARGVAVDAAMLIFLACLRVGAALSTTAAQPRGRKCLSERQIMDQMHKVQRLGDDRPEARDGSWIRLLHSRDPAAVERAIEACGVSVSILPGDPSKVH